MELEKKIDLLIEQLTIEEKIAMVHGAGLFRTGAVERLGIPPLFMSDGPMGVRADFYDAEWIPVGTPADAVTYCPSNTAIAMTWNRTLAGEAGKVLGREARGRGKDVILGPGINIKRSPLCGRNFEYFSEDPYLISELAVPMIRGIEESDVAACLKHFALNNQETERLRVNVEIDERTLREIYLPAFEAAVKEAHVRSVMGAYNLFRGQHACESEALLFQILRKEWGFDGTVISDWGAVHHTVAVGQAPLDIEMSVKADFDEYCMAKPLIEAIRDGQVEERQLDEKVRNILRLMVRIHKITLEEKDQGVMAVRDENRSRGSYDTPENRAATLAVARESIVLLKNEDHRLPLDESKVRKLLVIGQNAVTAHALGGGSAEIKALYEITPLLGIAKYLGGECQVDYTPGYYIPPKEESEVNWQEKSLMESEKKETQAQTQTLRKAEEYRQEALRLAAEYDDIIFVGGLSHEQDAEGQDREDIRLPYEQDLLISQLLEQHPDMTIVMMAGSPVSMEAWSEKAKAILWCGYCGMEGGTALAEILFGRVNPSGKLAETFPSIHGGYLGDAHTPREQFPGRPLTEEESARMDAHLTENYSEGVFVGYRYYEKHSVPVQFCFGHGLSYTTFDYSDMQVQNNEKGPCSVSITITNTGDCEGSETVQIYAGAESARPDDPVKELKGFAKVSLQPQESRRITIPLHGRTFMHYSEEHMQWERDGGAWILYAGASLEDIRCKVRC